MHPESAELWKENDLHVHVPAGISKVFIPYENVEDLDDVAEEVKEKLEIIPVKKVEDVLKRLKL